jgi:hypothetical protein
MLAVLHNDNLDGDYEVEEDYDISCDICYCFIWSEKDNKTFCNWIIDNNGRWICEYCFCCKCKEMEKAPFLGDFMERNYSLKTYENKKWCKVCLEKHKEQTMFGYKLISGKKPYNDVIIHIED